MLTLKLIHLHFFFLVVLFWRGKDDDDKEKFSVSHVGSMSTMESSFCDPGTASVRPFHFSVRRRALAQILNKKKTAREVISFIFFNYVPHGQANRAL